MMLEELEARGFIELLFEDGRGDRVYRFAYTFLRESLLQLQLYNTQRKPAHSRLIVYMQDNTLCNWQTEVSPLEKGNV